jgi:hypothetical protein
MDDETQSLYARAMGELSTRHTDVAFAAHAETALQPFADAVFPGLSASARAAWYDLCVCVCVGTYRHC